MCISEHEMTKTDQLPIGLRKGPSYKADLPPTVVLERNLIGVPTFVLHAKASTIDKKLAYSWRGEDNNEAVFTYERPDDTPFPLPQHAMFLDVMLAMFAQNFRDDGELRFRFADVLRNAGKDPDGQGGIRAVKETVNRYTRCQASWHYAWKGKVMTWHGPLIVGEDIYKMSANGPVVKRNPRKSKNPETWHMIMFHPHVVASVKIGHSRVFLAEALRSGLSPAAFCVYRYFYGFSDTSDVRRPIGQLRSAFPWHGSPGRFVKWLQEQLQELKEDGYVEEFTLTSDYASVRCTPMGDVKKKRVLAEAFELIRQ